MRFLTSEFRPKHRLKIADDVSTEKAQSRLILLYLSESRSFMEIDEMPSQLSRSVDLVACDSESQMGAYLAAIVETLNPDVVLGHELLGLHLPGVFELMNDEQQKMLSRFRSKDIDRSLRELVRYRVRKMFRGRLLCDTFGLSKENLRVDDYELEALAKKYLNLDERYELTEQLMYKAGKLLLMPQLVFELTENFEFLELTSELSKIAGCLWSVSLRSARAERNEMLLMHYFWKEGYVGRD